MFIFFSVSWNLLHGSSKSASSPYILSKEELKNFKQKAEEYLNKKLTTFNYKSKKYTSGELTVYYTYRTVTNKTYILDKQIRIDSVENKYYFQTRTYIQLKNKKSTFQIFSNVSEDEISEIIMEHFLITRFHNYLKPNALIYREDKDFEFTYHFNKNYNIFKSVKRVKDDVPSGKVYAHTGYILSPWDR